MDREDLHDAFIGALYEKIPRRVELVTRVADILRLEKESVYRRLAGKVNFSIREMGILARKLNMSLDSLVFAREERLWIPFVPVTPSKFHSLDSFCDMIDFNLQRIREIARNESGAAGSVYNSLPMEFFVMSPLLMKFMFFKWGNYFVRSEQFNDFSTWELPAQLAAIPAKYNDLCGFRDAFCIWDNSLIWTLVREIDNFYRMHVLSAVQKNEIKEELKNLLLKIEQALNGTYVPDIPLLSEMDFYVSSLNIGLTSCYYTSGDRNFALLQTNFSFSRIENSGARFDRIREWIDSFRKISTLLSGSGRMERRLFFESQHRIIDQVL